MIAYSCEYRTLVSDLPTNLHAGGSCRPVPSSASAAGKLEPRRRAATPGPGESVSDMGACGVVGGAESARAM